MNFLIFRDFSRFFMNLFELNSFKIFILSCAEVADNVVRMKKWHHVATYETATCHARVHVCTCVRVCARVCTCIFVYKEKAPC